MTPKKGRKLAQKEAQAIPLDRGQFRCPRCGWPLNPQDENGDGFVTCACGASVEAKTEVKDE